MPRVQPQPDNNRQNNESPSDNRPENIPEMRPQSEVIEPAEINYEQYEVAQNYDDGSKPVEEEEYQEIGPSAVDNRNSYEQ